MKKELAKAIADSIKDSELEIEGKFREEKKKENNKDDSDTKNINKIEEKGDLNKMKKPFNSENQSKVESTLQDPINEAEEIQTIKKIPA